MPLGWIHNLPREELEKLAVELAVPTQGNLDDLRKRVKQKWSLLEPYLPPRNPVESEGAVHVAGSGEGCGRSSNMHGHIVYSQVKLRGKVVADLVRNVPVLSKAEPEKVFQFLLGASEVYDLHLVSDGEFLALLVTRTTGRFTQIIGSHLSTSATWGAVRADIVSMFLPPRIREVLLAKYVLDRFQLTTEELSHYVMSVVAAADILNYRVSESELVERLLQNIHPQTRSRLVFSARPMTIKELHLLATQVAEGQAVEQRRIFSEARPVRARAQTDRAGSSTVSMAVGETRRPRSRVVKCWRCSGYGHVKRDCPSVNFSGSNPGNEGGARQ